MAAVARENIEGSLRGVLATLAPEEANAQRLDAAERVLATASKDLHKVGLVLDTLKIQSISDDQGYLEAIVESGNELRLTVVDSPGNGSGVPSFVRTLTGSIVTVFEQLKNGTGLDVAQILQSKPSSSESFLDM